MDFNRFRSNGGRVDTELPKLFLKLPKMKSIHKSPEHPYSFDTEGVIHSSKMTEIIEILLEKQDKLVELRKILEGHQLASKIKPLSIDEVAEFTIHTLMANRETLGWDIVDRIDNEISRMYTPRWLLPSLDFSHQLQSIFSTFIENKLNENTKQSIIKMKEKFVDLMDDTVEFNDFINATQEFDKNIITIRSIFSLYTNIRYLIEKRALFQTEYKQNLQELETILMDFIYSETLDNPEHKILLFALFINSYISDNPQKIETCQFIYDKMESNMTKLSEHQKLSYSWILNAIRSRISSYINKYSTDMISEDILINSLTNTFLNPDGVDLEKWSRTIVNPDIDPRIFAILIDGYIAISDILKEYYSGVTDPPKIPKFNQLNDFIYNSTKKYLINVAISQTDKEIITSKFDSVFSMITLPHQLKEEFIEVVINSISNKILFDDYATIQNISYINTLDNLNKFSVFTSFNVIKINNLKILTDTFPLDEFFETIMKEVNETGSFITSKVFEDQIISVYADMFQKAKLIEENLGEIPVDMYEHMVFYLAEWLRRLLKGKYVESEIILLLLPFIKISLLMIEKYYELHNQLTKAKLVDLNTFLLELYLGIKYGVPDFNQIKGIRDKDQLIDEFVGVLKDFNLESYFDISSIRIFSFVPSSQATSIAKKSRTDLFQSKKFDDDKIISYMEIRDDLNEFLNFIEQASIDKMKEELPNYAEKFSGGVRNFNFMSKVGTSKQSKELQTLIFPFFKNIEVLSIALELFPIELELQRFDIST